jgi:uncharacterized protein (DUF1501 family)
MNRHEHANLAGQGRRDFLRIGAAMFPALLAPSALARALTVPRAADAANDRVLVVLELAGGNDGLNTVVPFRDDAYHRARGALALDAGSLRKITDDVALHGALAPFERLFGEGKLAIVEGAGYPDPTRSHFLSMDVWHTASGEGRRKGSGWIGRLADQQFAADGDPNAVVALGRKVPYSCEGEHHRAVALTSTRGYRVAGTERAVETLDSAVASQQVSERGRRFLAQAYLEARASSDAIREALANHRPKAEYPSNNPLATDLATVASLIAGGVGTRVFAVSLGGFDTHSGQVARQARLLETLGTALAAFHADLEGNGLADRVAVVAFSEFGRRVKANASGGTDHGTAGPMFVLGNRVRGGLHGERPGLERLDDNGDLLFTTDFRRVYAALIEDWLGGDAGAVLGPGFAPLPLLA